MTGCNCKERFGPSSLRHLEVPMGALWRLQNHHRSRPSKCERECSNRWERVGSAVPERKLLHLKAHCAASNMTSHDLDPPLGANYPSSQLRGASSPGSEASSQRLKAVRSGSNSISPRSGDTSRSCKMSVTLSNPVLRPTGSRLGAGKQPCTVWGLSVSRSEMISAYAITLRSH